MRKDKVEILRILKGNAFVGSDLEGASIGTAIF